MSINMETKEEATRKFCPIIGKNCIADGCVYWQWSDGWNNTKHPSSDNGYRGYCKEIR